MGTTEEVFKFLASVANLAQTPQGLEIISRLLGPIASEVHSAAQSMGDPSPPSVITDDSGKSNG